MFIFSITSSLLWMLLRFEIYDIQRMHAKSFFKLWLLFVHATEADTAFDRSSIANQIAHNTIVYGNSVTILPWLVMMDDKEQ